MKTNHLLGIVGIRILLMPLISAKPRVITDQVEADNSDESKSYF